MICREIIEILERHWSSKYAMEWDNVGLLVGREEKEVSRVFVCLDATEETIAQAVDWKADMMISHHPMIFSAVKRITDQDFLGRKILTLASCDIAYYAMHTNFDVMGMAALNEESLSLSDTSSLMVTDQESGEGIGRIGNLAWEMTLEELADFVKERLKLPNVLVYGDLQQNVKRAAVSGGSGKSVIGCALQAGAQVLVTGDIDYHAGIDAVAQGLAIIDAGHYGTESIFIPYLERRLKELIPELEIRGAKIAMPFRVV